MTINGAMQVASVAEEVTVTSQAPTIDLEAATVGVNWNQSSMDNLPWGRAVAALTRMIPGTTRPPTTSVATRWVADNARRPSVWSQWRRGEFV